MKLRCLLSYKQKQKRFNWSHARNKSLAKEGILLRNERKRYLGGSSSVYESLTTRREIQVQIPRKPAEKQHPEPEGNLSHSTMQ